MADEAPAKDTTVTEPVVEDGKLEQPKTVPAERLSEVSAQKNAFKEEAEKANAKLAEYEADKKKVRDAQLIEDGEFKTAIAERDATIETLTTERDTAVKKWDNYESVRREAKTSGLTDEDKAMAMKIEDLTDFESFVDRISETKLPSADNRNASVVSTDGKLKPITDQTPREQRDTHEDRLAHYRDRNNA